MPVIELSPEESKLLIDNENEELMDIVPATKNVHVYMMHCLPTNQLYIGKTKSTVRQRISQHWSYALTHPDHNTKKDIAIRKYSERINWEFSVLETNLTADEGFQAEEYFIETYDTFINGLNENAGGAGNRVKISGNCKGSVVRFRIDQHIGYQTTFAGIIRAFPYLLQTCLREENSPLHDLRNVVYGRGLNWMSIEEVQVGLDPRQASNIVRELRKSDHTLPAVRWHLEVIPDAVRDALKAGVRFKKIVKEPENYPFIRVIKSPVNS